MSTVVADRPDVLRHVIRGLIQLAIAGGLIYLLLRGPPSSRTVESTAQTATRWGLGLLIAIPTLVWGLRNVHRLLMRGEIRANETGLSARIPVRAGWSLPWLRTLDWSAAWDDVSAMGFRPGRKAALTIEGAGEPLVLRGGEFAASLYDIDAAIREAAPDRARARIPMPEAVREYLGTQTLWIAISGLIALAVTILLVSFIPERLLDGVAKLPFVAVPLFLGPILLALAAVGRREAFIDERGFFLVHGKHTAHVTANALRTTGEWKLVSEFPGFRLMRLKAREENEKIALSMNQALGLGLPLAALDADLSWRARQGFEAPGRPGRRA